MNIDHRNPRLRRGFAFVALAALLGLSVVGLSQCRMVDDKVTGVDLTADSGVHARSSCVSECNAKFRACLRGEESEHKNDRKLCGWDKHCRKGADRDHKNRLLECVRKMIECKRHCYNEGAGVGGH